MACPKSTALAETCNTCVRAAVAGRCSSRACAAGAGASPWALHPQCRPHSPGSHPSPQTQTCMLVSSCLVGDSSGNTTQAPASSVGPGPEQPPTPAETRAASVQGASPAPQDPPPRLNLTGAVRVLCEIEKVAIAVERRFLQQESIPESSLYLGHPSCNVSDSNSTHVFLVASWSECGTLVQSVSPGAAAVQAACTSIRAGPALTWGLEILCTLRSLRLSEGPAKESG